MRRRTLSVCAIVVLTLTPFARSQPTDFEGFGAATLGALSSPDGFDTVHVTSLADDGPGTLREAVAGPKRWIVFDVAGTITLESHLAINQSYLTIDGGSAPSPGVTIELLDDFGITIEPTAVSGPAHDIVVTNLRLDGLAGGVQTNAGDLLGIDAGNDEVYNIVLDHITARDSTDGIFDITGGNVHDITISYCLIMDTVSVTLVRGFGIMFAARNISLHHNVWANCAERMPRVRGNVQTLDMVNNVFYRWDVGEGGTGATQIVNEPDRPLASVNITNNHYFPSSIGKPGWAIVYGSSSTALTPGPSDDGGPSNPVAQGTVIANSLMGSLFVLGNILPAENVDHWSTLNMPVDVPIESEVTTYDAQLLHEMVVPFVGTQFPTASENALLIQMAAVLVGDLEARGGAGGAGDGQTGTEASGGTSVPAGCGTAGLPMLMFNLCAIALVRASRLRSAQPIG